MDELQGDQGAWQFDGEAVQIRYHGKRSQDPLLKRLGQCRVPLAAVARAEFDPLAAGKRWSLRLVLREGADPYAAVGVMLTKKAQPFRLTVKGSTSAIGEYWAEQLSFAVRQAVELQPEQPEPGQLARQLVPPVPFHIKSSEGTAVFDGGTVRLTWSMAAPSRKRRERFREFPLAEIRRVEWFPTDGWQWDVLRVVTAETESRPENDPKRDLSSLRCYPGTEGADALLLAATVTAYQWTSMAKSDRVAELDGMLTRLHHEGLLTDDELTTKRAQIRS